MVDHNNGEVVGGANQHTSGHRGEYIVRKVEMVGMMGEADHGHDDDGDREM